MSVTAYRGAGRPEAALAIERAIDFFAAEIGMDPAEVRRRNFIPKFMEPYTTGIGTVYDVGDYEEAMRRVLDAADYPGAARRAGRSNEPVDQPCRPASASPCTSRSPRRRRPPNTARCICSRTVACAC